MGKELAHNEGGTLLGRGRQLRGCQRSRMWIDSRAARRIAAPRWQGARGLRQHHQDRQDHNERCCSAMHALNNQTASIFYIIRNLVKGLTNFIAYVNADLNGFDQQHHPLVSVVWTSGMPGWGTWGVNHYQWVVAFDDATNFVEYGDSAGPNSNPYGDPYGWHTTVSLSDYYSHVQQAIDEIIW